MLYNDNKNNLFYIILLLICLVTSIQIMLNKNVIKDPIAHTSFKNSFGISDNVIKATSSKEEVNLLIDASPESGLDVYINGERVLNMVNGEVRVKSSFGDVFTFNNPTEEDIVVYVDSDDISFADNQGNLFSTITIRACSEVDYYFRTEK